MSDDGQQRKWEVVEDRYHRCLRYVLYPSGLIIGHVQGKNADPHASWTASTDGQDGGKRIGTYVTEGLAKKAVEAANDEDVR